MKSRHPQLDGHLQHLWGLQSEQVLRRELAGSGSLCVCLVSSFFYYVFLLLFFLLLKVLCFFFCLFCLFMVNLWLQFDFCSQAGHEEYGGPDA